MIYSCKVCKKELDGIDNFREHIKIHYYKKNNSRENKIKYGNISKFYKSEKNICINDCIRLPNNDRIIKGLSLVKFKCNKCGTVFECESRFSNSPRCLKCNPLTNYVLESRLYDFIRECCSDAKKHDRSILKGKELDVYIPSKKLAIELDGLRWHSEISGNKNKDYHLDKTIRCELENIQLLHIFEDEWISKENIVKSVLKKKLKLIKHKIYSTKCNMKKVNTTEAKKFLNTNHLQGYIKGTHYGLYSNKKLVSILTYRKSKSNDYDIEILRFCNKIDINVTGSLSKLVSNIKMGSIVMYVDRRYGLDNLIISSGFKLIGKTKPTYYYTRSGSNKRIDRVQFRKRLLNDKLESFDPNLTEWENMKNNGFDRIWDCGNYIYTFKRDNK